MADYIDSLRAEQVKLLYSNVPASLLGQVVLALIFVIVQSEVIAPAILAGWLILLLIILLGWLILFRLWRRSGVDCAGAYDPRWLLRFRILSIALGGVWGIGGALMFPPDDTLHQVFLLLVLGGLASAAVIGIAIEPVSTISFVLPTALPILVRMVMEGSEFALAAALMSGLFMSFITLGGLRVGQNFKENVRLHVEARLREQALQQSEAELRLAKEQSDEANRAKSEFLARMSHELRTPLNAIIGFAQMLDMGVPAPLSPEQKESIGYILNGGHHLLGLINEVLDLARIEAGKLDVEVEAIVLDDAIEQAVTLTVPIASRRQIAIRTDRATDMFVFADAARLRQILLNLLSNAVKYNCVGGEVTVSCQARGDFCRITVMDTGSGIPEELQSQLFEPFQRLGAERTVIEGTGIGLVICKRLAEAMGGRIGFDSRVGTGSRFWFELPAASRSVAQALVPVAVEQPVDGGSVIYGRVLYVEDNPFNQSVMQMVFRQFPDIELLIAECAETGLALVRSNPPDLVLMDNNLPGMSGLAAMRSLKSDPLTCHIPVVAVTASAMPIDIRDGIEAGFMAYLTKPFDVLELIGLVRKVLQGEGRPLETVQSGQNFL